MAVGREASRVPLGAGVRLTCKRNGAVRHARCWRPPGWKNTRGRLQRAAAVERRGACRPWHHRTLQGRSVSRRTGNGAEAGRLQRIRSQSSWIGQCGCCPIHQASNKPAVLARKSRFLLCGLDCGPPYHVVYAIPKLLPFCPGSSSGIWPGCSTLDKPQSPTTPATGQQKRIDSLH